MPTLAQSVSDDNDEDLADVRAKLTRELNHLSSQNYRQVGEPDIELVKGDDIERFQLELKAGVTYAIVAACDTDCSHVAVALRDSQGQLLMQSPDKHHTVIINGTPSHSARHVAEVSTPGCREREGCYAGLMLLRQVSADFSPTGQRSPEVAGALIIAPPRGFTSYDNYDLVGTDLRKIRDTSIETCVSACEGDARCVGYSFDKWNRSCFLKGAANVFRLEPNTITGLRPGTGRPPTASNPATMQRYRNKAFPWTGQNTQRADSFEDCEQRCQHHPTCIAFTFFKDSNQCRLMESTGEYFADAKADSGVKRQEPRE